MKTIFKKFRLVNAFLIMVICTTSQAQTLQSNQGSMLGISNHIDQDYDHIGEEHNRVVAEFLKRYANESLNLEETLMRSNELCRALNVKGEPLTMRQLKFGISDFKNNFNGVVRQCDVSPYAKEELQKLFDYLTIHAIKADVNLEQSTSFIQNYEKSIYMDKNLTAKDKQLILSVASVARHSTSFWNTYYKTQNLSKSGSRTPGWLRWLVVGAADAVGTIAGGGVNVVAGIGASTSANVLVTEVDNAK